MALLCFNPLPSLSSSSSSSPLPLATLAVATFPMVCVGFPVSRLHIKGIDEQPKSLNGVCLHATFSALKRGAVVVKASSDIDGTAPTESSETPSESKEEAVSVEKLPLESKEQQKLEQKMRMKLAKKIRLRRKRLLRKRKMRKKGRWPPSKMNKLKNV